MPRKTTMIDEALEANSKYAERFGLGDLPVAPARKLVVIACMDARLTVEDILGLRTGDAHIIRNAGGTATEDAIRSVVISHQLLGTREVVIINHTKCGMQTFRDEDLCADLAKKTGTRPDTLARLLAFTDLEEHVREQVALVRDHPWISNEVTVRGFIYDVECGRLKEVT